MCCKLISKNWFYLIIIRYSSFFFCIFIPSVLFLNVLTFIHIRWEKKINVGNNQKHVQTFISRTKKTYHRPTCVYVLKNKYVCHLTDRIHKSMSKARLFILPAICFFHTLMYLRELKQNFLHEFNINVIVVVSANFFLYFISVIIDLDNINKTLFTFGLPCTFIDSLH